MPAHCGRERYLHFGVQRVRGYWERGFVEVVESVGMAPCPAVIHLSGKAMAGRGARGENVGITAPMRNAEDTGESGRALEAVVNGLRRAKRTNGNDALVDKGLERPSDVFDEGFGAKPTEREVS